ncbi:MAG: hypothetical protein U5K72_02595 [Balneolaceae bacterium]|nr:hypothetical protein [Balneolaceae bacterium]
MFGLQNKSSIKIYFDVNKYEIDEITGLNQSEVSIEISDTKVFSMPSHLLIDGEPLFPTKYEILNSGKVIYSSSKVPAFNISITDDNFLNFRSKEKRYTIKPTDLKLLCNSKRKRKPSQKKIMGQSASKHALNFIENGLLKIETTDKIDWHWCHLIAFSLIPTSSAQRKNNLVCGTSACNGHMMNIETAIKKFIMAYDRPLGLEVRAQYYKESHLATRIRYRNFLMKKPQKCPIVNILML